MPRKAPPPLLPPPTVPTGHRMKSTNRFSPLRFNYSPDSPPSRWQSRQPALDGNRSRPNEWSGRGPYGDDVSCDGATDGSSLSIHEWYHYSSPERAVSVCPPRDVRGRYRSPPYAPPQSPQKRTDHARVVHHKRVHAPHFSERHFLDDTSMAEHLSSLRGSHSVPGALAKTGDAQKFKRFGSQVVWITDDYAKHKQQGPAYYNSP